MIRQQSIRRKLTAAILFTSGAVLVVVSGTFFIHELLTFRRTMAHNLSIVGRVVAANSTAALAFQHRSDASEVLSALSAEQHVVAAGLYDQAGALFATYPDTAPDNGAPARLERDGYRFTLASLVVQEPVVIANRQLGTLVVQSNLGALYERLALYGLLISATSLLALVVAFPLSNRLQKRISGPILALADTAKAVSDGHDYSLRAAKVTDDELGRLVDAFNEMLAQIQAQDAALRQQEADLRREVAERLRAEEQVRSLNASLEERVSERTEALRESEARYRMLFDSIDEGYCLIEMLFDGQDTPVDYRFLEINPSFEKQTGLRGALGRTMRELIPQHEEYWFETYGRVAVTGRPARFQQYAEQLQRWYDVYAYRFGHPQDRQVAVVFSDITDAKRLETQLRRNNEELEEQNRRVERASRFKSAFLANMSHELRTPLNSIIGFAELMHDGRVGPISDTHKEYLGDILSSGRHLLQLINDVLDLSKVESGKMEFHPEPVDLKIVAAEVRDIVRAVAGKKRIPVAIEVDPALGIVSIDSGRLKQVLYNYLSNAIKFTAEEGRVTLRFIRASADTVRVEVEDTGIGIRAEDLPRLFREFEQVDASTSKKYAGTGLGLALTKRIVEAQGGHVGVESTPDVGSTFFAELPLVVPPAAATTGARASGDSGQDVVGPGNE